VIAAHQHGNDPGLQGIWSLGLALQNGTEEAEAAQLAAKGVNPRAALLRPGI